MTLRLWFVLTAGPVLWLIHLSGASALVPYACANDARWMVDALTVVTALPTAAALVLGLRMQRSDPDPVAIATGRRHLLPFLGVLFSVTSLALILLEGAPNLVLAPCR